MPIHRSLLQATQHRVTGDSTPDSNEVATADPTLTPSPPPSSSILSTSSAADPSPLESFFAHYPLFTYTPTESAPTTAFARLVQQLDWAPDAPERTAARRLFREALTEQFNWTFGSDARDLGAWRTLCGAVGLDDSLASVTQCRKALRSVHVNLVDLINPARITRGDPVRRFESVRALAKYSKSSKKIFPKEVAKAGGVLRALLRPLFS